MCTASWIRTQDGFEVFFNRDELATRGPGLPPRAGERGGVRFTAPLDGDEGGTWIGANELGLALGIANGAATERDRGAGPFVSRGLLVLGLLGLRSSADVERAVRAEDLGRRRSFSLFALEPGGLPLVLDWDGRRLETGRVAGEGALLFTSSRDAARARAERTALLERLRRGRGRVDAELLLVFHSSHEPARGPWSPCMHRADASTVSFTRVRVAASEVRLEHRPGPPCAPSGPAVAVRLPRISPGSGGRG